MKHLSLSGLVIGKCSS